MSIKFFNRTKKVSRSKFDLLSDLIKDVSELQTDLIYANNDDDEYIDKTYIMTIQTEIDFKRDLIDKLIRE